MARITATQLRSAPKDWRVRGQDLAFRKWSAERAQRSPRISYSLTFQPGQPPSHDSDESRHWRIDGRENMARGKAQDIRDLSLLTRRQLS